MGKIFDRIDNKLADFIKRQKMFFVATAPLGADGHVNLSPKGCEGSFAVLGPASVAYLDLPGSGIETVAHIRQNRRITILFCAFEGPPKILRLYGRGEALEPGQPDFDALAPRFRQAHYPRTIIRVVLDRIADSCGFGVPRYTYAGDRDALDSWAAKYSREELKAYVGKNNARSIDGLPGLP